MEETAEEPTVVTVGGDSTSDSTTAIGDTVQAEGPKLLNTLVIGLVVLGLLWIGNKLYSWFLGYAEGKKKRIIDKENNHMQSARQRQMQRLEEEAEKFKLTDDYQDILKASKDETQGIQPHHHRHTVSKATDQAQGGGPNPYFDGSFNSRTNKPSFDPTKRRPGGGGG
eukprot:GHVS01103563.1.p1 GENE.GHVS01103563.1~~GHVS01103563.1.p1  ORF type:complete len:168 (+),score=31.14 GHVS01103563.1:101-604(+)